MKSFIAITLLSLAASFSSAAPTCNPPPTTTTTTPFVTPTGPPFTPELPLKSFQLPVTLPNGVVALGAYLQIKVDQTKPDETIFATAAIGSDVYTAFEFNSTHAGKRCRFHFSFSAGDGGNDLGSQEIYRLKSGTVDEKTTFNNKPVSEDTRVAAFLQLDPVTGKRLALGDSSNGDSLLFTLEKEDFDCPTELTGYEVRGAAEDSPAKSLANWSWNHGLIVEVLGENSWEEGLEW